MQKKCRRRRPTFRRRAEDAPGFGIQTCRRFRETCVGLRVSGTNKGELRKKKPVESGPVRGSVKGGGGAAKGTSKPVSGCTRGCSKVGPVFSLNIVYRVSGF